MFLPVDDERESSGRLSLGWHVHLAGSVLDSSTGVVVNIRPGSSSSSVGSLNLEFDYSVELEVVLGFVGHTSLSELLVLTPEFPHWDLTVDALVFDLEVGLSCHGTGTVGTLDPFVGAVHDLNFVTLNGRSVVSSSLPRELQLTILRINGRSRSRNFGGSTGSLDFVRGLRELTPSPSVAASNLVVHVMRR